MIAEIEKERMIMLGGVSGDHQKNDIDEEDIEVKLTRMLGGVGGEQEPLL